MNTCPDCKNDLVCHDQGECLRQNPMTPDTPPPGSDAAIKQGCTCPVMDNAHGKGYMCMEGVCVYNGDCPLHNPPHCTCEPQQDTAPRHPMDYDLGCPIHWEIRIDYEKARDRCR